MLTERPIIPVVHVRDLERARDFYENKLGLHEADRPSPAPDAILLRGGGGTMLELERRDRVPDSEQTVLTFEVDDVDREIEDLEGRGVQFEDYDLPELKTEGHIAEMNGSRAAWFRDPDGNILCIHQRVTG